eukprot:3319571-Prymnesium_polylepis.1
MKPTISERGKSHGCARRVREESGKSQGRVREESGKSEGRATAAREVRGRGRVRARGLGAGVRAREGRRRWRSTCGV